MSLGKKKMETGRLLPKDEKRRLTGSFKGIDRRSFCKIALAAPVACCVASPLFVGGCKRVAKNQGDEHMGHAKNESELRKRLETSLDIFRKKLAANSDRKETRAYLHIESLMRNLLDMDYFSPYHTIAPMPNVKETLAANLTRLNQVIWILTGEFPDTDSQPVFHVRPYHPAYFIDLFDVELAPKNINRLDDVVSRIKTNLDTEVEIVRGLDDVCMTCVKTDIYRCIKDSENQKHWDKVNDTLLVKQGLSYGQRMLVRDLMKRAVNALPSWKDTCGVCTAKNAQRYEAGRQGWLKLLD